MHLEYITLHIVFSSLAPADSPQGFIADALGPRSIMLQWLRPTTPNGIIIGYTLVYTNTSSMQSISLGNVLNHTLENLNEFTNYTFALSAATSAGMGPNATVIEMTEDDGK